MSYYNFNRNCYQQTCAITSNTKFINPSNVNYKKEIFNKKKNEKHYKRFKDYDQNKKNIPVNSLDCSICS